MVLSLSTSWCFCESFSYLLWVYAYFLSFYNCESWSLRATISLHFWYTSRVSWLIFSSASFNCFWGYSYDLVYLGILSMILNVSCRVVLKSSNFLALSSASYFLVTVSCRICLVSLNCRSTLLSKLLSSLIFALFSSLFWKSSFYNLASSLFRSDNFCCSCAFWSLSCWFSCYSLSTYTTSTWFFSSISTNVF